MTQIQTTKLNSYEPRIPKKAPPGADLPPKGAKVHEIVNENRMLGGVIGNAVGDALGAPAEFRNRGSLIDAYGENGLRKMGKASTTGGKDEGSYTDDTEMLVCVGRGIVDASNEGQVHRYCHFISKRNAEWLRSGPPDVGGLTRGVLGSVMRGSTGHDAAWDYAFKNGRADANGAIMRNAITFPFTRSASFVDMMLTTEQICATTHASHQCRHSAAAMTLLMRRLCISSSPRKAIEDTHTLLKSWGCNDRVLQAFEFVLGGKYKTAAEVPTSGWVIDTLERALWCLALDAGFEEGLVTCVMMGGDADTAGAVAGALLGTYYGIDQIPTEWVEQVEASEKKYRAVSLRELTVQVAAIGDKFFRP